MRAIAFAALALLAGCATTSKHLDATVPTYQGRNVHALIDKLGYPAHQAVIAGDTVYTWTSTIGRFNAAVAALGATNDASSCVIQAVTDNAGTIKHIEWHGDWRPCGGFADALE